MRVQLHPLPYDGQSVLARYRAQHHYPLVIMRLLDLDWPQTSATVTRLCHYITDALVVDDQSVLFAAFNHGLARYQRQWTPMDPQRLLIWLNTVIDRISAALAHTALVDLTDQALWVPTTGAPLGDWLTEDRCQHVDQLRLARGPTSQAQICAVLQDAVLSEGQKMILEREAQYG